jgi:hypothetical protein
MERDGCRVTPLELGDQPVPAATRFSYFFPKHHMKHSSHFSGGAENPLLSTVSPIVLWLKRQTRRVCPLDGERFFPQVWGVICNSPGDP